MTIGEPNDWGSLNTPTVESIWQSEISPIKLRGVSVRKPILLLTGGQPGSGKTHAILRAKRLYERGTPWTDIIGDDLRQFDPRYLALLRDDVLAMPRVTAVSSGQWINMSLEYVRERRFNTVLEGTWRNEKMVSHNAVLFKKSEFVVHAIAIACDPAVSRLATAERFYLELARGMPARWTPVEAHDVAYEALPGTVRALLREAAHRFTVIDRSGSLLYDGMLDSDQDRVVAWNAFNDTRHAQMEELERASWHRRFELLQDHRGIGPEGPEVDRMWHLLDLDAARIRHLP